MFYKKKLSDHCGCVDFHASGIAQHYMVKYIYLFIYFANLQQMPLLIALIILILHRFHLYFSGEYDASEAKKNSRWICYLTFLQ